MGLGLNESTRFPVKVRVHLLSRKGKEPEFVAEFLRGERKRDSKNDDLWLRSWGAIFCDDRMALRH